MANRRPQQNNNVRRMDFGRNDNRNKNFGHSAAVSPWQGAGPGTGLASLLPLAGGTSQALALATNLIQMLQPRQQQVPSLLDMPVRRDFGPNMGPGRFNPGGYMPPSRMGPGMGNPNFRRTGYNRPGDRMNINRNRNQSQNQQRQPNKTTPKKEADKPKAVAKESDKEDAPSTAEDNKEESTTETKEAKEAASKETDKEKSKTRYDDIHRSMLKCHICNKSMWDGRSFENHLSGRAHGIMMHKTAESYALTADTMRQEFKIREMKRTRKTGAQTSRDFYCAMCDMYAADGAAHRTTVGHRKLKKYLHPACVNCHKEMPTRIELDEHRLTAEHLRNIQSKSGDEVNTKPKPEVMVISTLAMEQSYVREERTNKRRQDENKDKDNDNQPEVEGEEKKDVTEEGDVPMETDEEKKIKEEKMDKEDTVVDYHEGDDLSGLTKAQWPAYKLDRGVGRSFLEDFRCVQCKLCHKLLDSEETAEVHLKTWRHYQLFVRFLQDKSRKDDKKLAEAGDKRGLNSDEAGDPKRRRMTPDDEIKQECDQEMEENGITVHGEGDDGQEGDETNADDEMVGDGEELEDWGDEDGEGEQTNEEEQVQPEPEPEVEPEPEPEVEPEPELEPEPEPEPVKKTATPSRGRGRGRATGRARRARP